MQPGMGLFTQLISAAAVPRTLRPGRRRRRIVLPGAGPQLECLPGWLHHFAQLPGDRRRLRKRNITPIRTPAFVADLDLGAAPAAKRNLHGLTASANPVVPGTSVTFTAAVAPITGTGTPTGSMVFSVDEATVATVALILRQSGLHHAALPAGAHYVLASYTGSTRISPQWRWLQRIHRPRRRR